MGLADKLKQVVAANFIEIAREETPQTAGAAVRSRPGAYTNSSEDPGVWRRIEDAPIEPVEPVFVQATPVAVEVVAEPQAPADGTDASRWFEAGSEEFDGVLSADGTPDFARLFQNAGADLPAVSCSADDAIRILAEMPPDLPARVRRLTARTKVDRISESNPNALEEILSDGALKMMKIARLSSQAGEQAGVYTAALGTEIAALEAQLAERKALLAEIEGRQETVQAACRGRMSQLNDVVLFFDNPDVATATPDAIKAPGGVDYDHAAPDELPPFMRDDSVRKLLGLSSGKGKMAVAQAEPARVG